MSFRNGGVVGVAEPQVDVEGLPVAGLGFGELPLLFCNHAELVVAVGCLVPVVELQVDVEGPAVAGLGLIEPPLQLRHPAELMVGGGGAVPVAELQLDVEGPAVAGLGLVVPPLLLRHPAKLMVGHPGAAPLAEGLLELDFGLVVGLGVVEPVLAEGSVPGEVMHDKKMGLLMRWPVCSPKSKALVRLAYSALATACPSMRFSGSVPEVSMSCSSEARLRCSR